MGPKPAFVKRNFGNIVGLKTIPSKQTLFGDFSGIKQLYNPKNCGPEKPQGASSFVAYLFRLKSCQRYFQSPLKFITKISSSIALDSKRRHESGQSIVFGEAPMVGKNGEKQHQMIEIVKKSIEKITRKHFLQLHSELIVWNWTVNCKYDSRHIAAWYWHHRRTCKLKMGL